MKKTLHILVLLAFTFIFQQCTSQNMMNPTVLKEIINSKNFTFEASKAIPTSAEAVNVLNSMNNGAGRVLNLTPGEYSVIFKTNEIESSLPYFGRNFSGNSAINTDKNSLNFKSKDFILQTTTTRNNSTVFEIKPKDINTINIMVLEIFTNGKATLSIDSKDRQPISYDGYIAPIKEKKN